MTYYEEVDDDDANADDEADDDDDVWMPTGSNIGLSQFGHYFIGVAAPTARLVHKVAIFFKQTNPRAFSLVVRFF